MSATGPIVVDRQRDGRPPLRRGGGGPGAPHRSRDRRARRGAARRLRPGPPVVAVRRRRRRRTSRSASPAGTPTTASSSCSATPSSPSTPPPTPLTTASGRAIAYGACVLATGSSPVRAADPRHRRRRRVRVPHDRRPRGHPRVGVRLRHRRGRRRRPARPGGGQRPAAARPRHHRRRVRRPADGRAARRGRRPRAAPPRRGARPRTCAPAPRPPRCAPRPTAGSPGCAFADDALPDLDADLVVFAAGIRPRDELARAAGPRRSASAAASWSTTPARTSAPDVLAIGEVACHGGRIYGLVAPGYAMAEVVADRLAGGDATFTGADLSTRLKLLGVDVAGVGDPHADGDEVVVSRPDDRRVAARRARRRRPGARRRRSSATPRPSARSSRPCAAAPPPADVLGAARARAPAGGAGRADWPTSARVCSCHNVDAGSLRAAVARGVRGRPGAQGVHQGRHRLRVVRPDAAGARRRAAGRRSGRVVVKRLCPHFAMSRAELFDVVRVTGIRTFAELVDRHGTGRGCEICKPAVASMFASLGVGLHPRRRAGQPPGHQRPLPRQPPARRHLLRRAPRARRRDHAREAHRHRRGRPRLRPLHEDHRRPAHRPARRPGRAAAGHLAPAASTPASSRATPTARRCAP